MTKRGPAEVRPGHAELALTETRSILACPTDRKI